MSAAGPGAGARGGQFEPWTERWPRTAPRASEAFWEDHHRRAAPGTGGPNVVLVETVGALPAGRALDLGCGGGGDALWLAGRGWRVTTVDVSATALERVARRAREAGVAERVRTERHDVAASLPDGAFDLVSAHYLHSPVDFPRAAALRAAAGRVVDGGLLLVVDHASTAPWSWADPGTVYPSAQQTLDGIGLDQGWSPVRVEAADRRARGPGGQVATVTDNVIALRRTAGGSASPQGRPRPSER